MSKSNHLDKAQMRIIHVTQFLGIGGLEKIIYHLALHQQSQSHFVTIYVYDYEQTWVDFFRKSGLRVVTPKLKKKGYDINLIKRLSNDVKEYDVIHSHDLNPLMYLGPVNLWKKLTFQKKPKLIHTTHGLDHVDKYPKGRLYQKYFSRLADKVICVSKNIGEFYLKEIGADENKIKIIQNGIPTYAGMISDELRRQKKRWLANRHGLAENRPIILCLSRVTPLKNQSFIIEALIKRPIYQLVIVGPPTDPDYYKFLQQQENKNIKLVGAQELIWDYNLGADLCVSASTHEGIPVSILEAMASETPCLVSEIPGHMALLKHGQYIHTFELQNQDLFLEKIESIFNNYDEHKIKAKESRKIVDQHFSIEQMAIRYLEEYHS